jgi:outer membrane protein TolC
MLAVACACAPALAQRVAETAPAGKRPQTRPLEGIVTLSPKLLLQLVVQRSAEVSFSKEQIEVATQLTAAEESLYEPVAYATARRDGGPRQRTVEERIASISTSNQNILHEQVSQAETGVRTRLLTGGDLSVAYRLRQRSNNIIASAAKSDTEFDGAVTMTFKQPLLKGRGRDVIETDLKVARLERRIALLQYQQQLMKTGSDALGVYWQLYRAIEVQQIRQLALDYAHRVESDTTARIDAGKLASSNKIEARAAVLLREVEGLRAEQGVREAESRLATVLNVANISGTRFGLTVAANAADFTRLNVGSAEQRYEGALERWPALGIARLRYEQAGLRLAYAKNQSLPTLDLVFSRSNTGLAQDNRSARELAEKGRYPGWSVGLNLEIPLLGNGRAAAQYGAQSARVQQSEIEIESISNALANDVRSRWEQAVAGQQEVNRMKGDVELRAELLRIEQVRYDAGLGQLSQLLQRESDLTESRQRLVESNTRLGQANDALLAADGSLLDHYDIYLKD